MTVCLTSLVSVMAVSWLSWWLAERPFLGYRKENPAHPLAGATGWVVHRPWPAALMAGAVLITGDGFAGQYLRPADDILASCTQRGFVDTPERLSTVQDPVYIAGWAYDWDPHRRVRRVVFTSGGQRFAEAPLGRSRGDVVAALPGCRVGRPGFGIALPLAQFPSQTEDVVVHAERGNGEQFEIGRIPWAHNRE